MQILLLILGGDVELNPGPGKCEYQHMHGYTLGYFYVKT